MPVKKKSSARGTIVLVLFLVAVGAAYRFRPRKEPISEDAVRRPMLAVLVFENQNQLPELDFLANALTHDTIGKIGQLCSSRVDIIGHESIITYRNSRKSLHQIGRELGVDYILEGSVLKDADKIRVSAQLTRVSDQFKLWSLDDDRSIGQVSDVQNQIIQKIATSLGVKIDPAELEAMNLSATENSIAREAYLHAVENCEDGTARGLKDCIALLEKALKADPKYPRAHVALADAELRAKANYQIAEDHVRRARQITDAFPEAHFVFAEILYKAHHDDKAADEEFRKAIALNRSDSEARLRYAAFLLEQNRIDEAETQITPALMLDPYRVDVNVMDGRILIAAKSYDRAIERLGNTVGLDRSSPEVRYYLGQAYFLRSMYDDAVREFGKAASFDPQVPEYAAALAKAREAAARRPHVP
jgi:TolB-like protein/Tfp pilus assembly protein PilF